MDIVLSVKTTTMTCLKERFRFFLILPKPKLKSQDSWGAPCQQWQTPTNSAPTGTNQQQQTDNRVLGDVLEQVKSVVAPTHNSQGSKDLLLTS